MSKSTRPVRTKADLRREPYLSSLIKLIPGLEVTMLALGLYYLGFARGGMFAWPTWPEFTWLDLAK